MRYATITLALLFAFGGSICAGDNVGGNSITAPGSAVLEVAPDVLVIEFELLTERNTFSEAAASAREIATALEGLDVPQDGVSVSVSYDLTFMKQKSWGRGTKLEHRFRMTVADVPAGTAQECLVFLVDKSLGLNGKLTVESFSAALSEDRALETRKQLFQEAVEDAQASASALASAAGLRIVSPTNISVGGGGPLTLGVGVSEMDVPGRFYRNFTVNASLVSSIRQQAVVVIRFSVERM